MSANIYGVGRLGRDPKMQYTDKGIAVTNITVAVTSGWGDKAKTTWLDLVAFAKQAEVLNERLEKGHRLSFTAELQEVNTYDKKDGSSGVSVKGRIITFDLIDSVKPADEPEEF